MSNHDSFDLLEKLKAKLLKRIDESISFNIPSINNKPFYLLYISFTDGNTRASVVKGRGDSFESAWKNALENYTKKVSSFKHIPIWHKVDIATNVEVYTYRTFIKHVSSIKNNYFRKGISFDASFNISFLEQEVNSNVFFFRSNDEQPATVAWKNINFYIKENTGLRLDLSENIVRDVYTFETLSAFHDGYAEYDLENGPLSNGRRVVHDMAPPTIKFYLEKASQYLSKEVKADGSYEYGYFPCFDKPIGHYNMLRHASTTYALIESYEVTHDETLIKSIERALEYLLREGVRSLPSQNDLPYSFVIEAFADNEIKIGANAAAILAFSKYTQIFDDIKYVQIIRQLANGIMKLQNEDGSFIHVVNFPDLTTKEAFRIIYYDGEAAFALMRAYDLTKNPVFLRNVEKAFDHFISKEYWKFHDHWLSYCSYELYKVNQNPEILAFNLKNTEGILDFALTRETTYPTLLELLMATANIIKYAHSNNLHSETIVKFNGQKLFEAIQHRLFHQLNGLMFPEFAMYFKTPSRIVWSFYIRHHAFRVRIDDVEHNLSGYCSYYSFLIGNNISV